jgi:hypothetical protein
MRRHGLVERRIKRRNRLTKQDKTAPKFADLIKRNFTVDQPNARWVGGARRWLGTVVVRTCRSWTECGDRVP